MRVLAGGFAVMQQTKEDAQNGVTDEHREGLAEYNEKISGQGGSSGGQQQRSRPGQQGRTPRSQQQRPAGAAPGAGARGRGTRSQGRRPNRRRRR